MCGTPRHVEHSADLWNYFYRPILPFWIEAKAFGNVDPFNSIQKFRDEFTLATGTDYQSNEWDEN